MAVTSTLSAVFADSWNPDMPSNLVDLMSADYDGLDEKAKALRALAVDLVHSFEREPVLTADIAYSLLEKHHLPARAGKWTFVALSKDLERVYVKSKFGGMRLLHWTGEDMPTPEKLGSIAPLPEGGTYLAVYGGTPSVLESDTERRCFKAIAGKHRVADLILWDTQGGEATFWSLRAQAGQSGTVARQFPNPELLERWWNENNA